MTMIIQLFKNGIDGETVIYVVAFLIAVMFSISIHEYAHGYVANKMGDDTAKRLGRLTLNPLAHLDIFGTLAFFIFGLALFPFSYIFLNNFTNFLLISLYFLIFSNIFKFLLFL